MEALNFVNLIQAGMVATGILGAILFWQTKPREFWGIAAFFLLMAFAAVINILEETGITRDIYLISPLFILLFGPATYLSAKLVIEKHLPAREAWHFLPAVPLLFFTSSYIYEVIAVGSLWRLGYAILTISLIWKYKRSLDQARSDADDHSLNWLVWVLGITAVFNLVDLVRLNIQPMIPYELNVFGQGVNNMAWLIASMVIIVMFQLQDKLPEKTEELEFAPEQSHTLREDYSAVFNELDGLIKSNEWYLKPRLTLADLSAFTGLQVREISRAINVVKELPFNEYINGFRVEHVCNAMQAGSENPILELAMAAGFSSKASFNKVFKQETGVTPSEYKKRLQR